MTEVMTDFVKFELLKISIGLTNGVNDDKLREITAECNQELDSQLKPYATSIPLDTGSIIYGQIQKTAIHYGRMLWFNHIKQHDLEERENAKYEAKLAVLIQSLKADRNKRGTTILVTADPRIQKIPLPSQRDTFILDGF